MDPYIDAIVALAKALEFTNMGCGIDSAKKPDDYTVALQENCKSLTEAVNVANTHLNLQTEVSVRLKNELRLAQKELEFLQQDNVSLRDQFDEKDDALTEASGLLLEAHKEVTSLSDENVSLRKEIDEMHDALAKASKSLLEAHNEVTSLRNELIEKDKDITFLRNEVERQHGEIVKLGTELRVSLKY